MKTLVLSLLLLLPASLAAGGELVLIMNKDSKHLVTSKSDVEKIFLGKKKKFSTGGPVEAVAHNEVCDEYEAFADYIGRSRGQLKSYWAKAIFGGRARPPRQFKTLPEVINYVSTHPEALSYCYQKDAQAAIRGGKRIRIIDLP